MRRMMSMVAAAAGLIALTAAPAEAKHPGHGAGYGGVHGRHGGIKTSKWPHLGHSTHCKEPWLHGGGGTKTLKK